MILHRCLLAPLHTYMMMISKTVFKGLQSKSKINL